jgi:hypothetical protein
MDAVCFSETLVPANKFVWRYNSEDQRRHVHRRENIRSHILPSDTASVIIHVLFHNVESRNEIESFPVG